MKSGLFLKILATLQSITLLPLLADAGISPCGQWPYTYAGAMQPGGLSPEDLSDFDFIVIGGGLSGSIISKRLTENDRWKVLVLEAGGNFGRNFNERAYLYTEPDWKAGLALQNHSTQWRRGAYSFNPLRWVYGLPEDYEAWRDMGNTDWGWDDVQPYLEMATKQLDDVYTAQGYLELTQIETRDYDRALSDVQRTVFEAYKEAMAINGKAVDAKSNASNYEMKYATSKLGIHRCNLRVIKLAEVVSIDLAESEKSVQKVTFVLRGKQTLEARCRKEVILAAGAIDSAKILMLSGIGPSKHLQSLGIRIRHDLPVGLGLQDHVVVPLFFEVPDLPGEVPHVMPAGDIVNIQKRGLFGYQGELIFSAFYGLNFSAIMKPNDVVELHYFYITKGDNVSLSGWSSNFHLKEQYENMLQQLGAEKNLLIVHVVLSHPKSKGKVMLSSKNYSDLPVIITNYFENNDDMKTMIKAVRSVYGMVNTPSFKKKGVKYVDNIIPDCRYKANSDQQWECIVNYFAATQYDHVGTVKMGPAEYGNCVNNRLLLNGIDNLRVIGASVIPSLPSGEVGAAAAMIAERAADFIKEEWGERAHYI